MRLMSIIGWVGKDHEAKSKKIGGKVKNPEKSTKSGRKNNENRKKMYKNHKRRQQKSKLGFRAF